MVIAVILIVLGYLGTTIGVWQSIQKRNVITCVALALILSGAVGVIWIAIDASKDTEQLKAKSAEIKKLNLDLLAQSAETTDAYKKLALSNEQLIKKSEESLRLSRIVIRKSEENAKLSRENLAQTKLFVQSVMRQEKQGKISKEAAQEILETLTLKASAGAIFEGDVPKTPSPPSKQSP